MADIQGAVKFFMVLNPVAHALEGHSQRVVFLATVNPQHFPLHSTFPITL